jgi:hypothetical protein
MVLKVILSTLLFVLAASPALAKGGGGGGGGGGAGGGNAGGGASAGHGAGIGNDTTGAGRDTALSAPGSQHRSSTATGRLTTSTPGKANPPSGVIPGGGRRGTVPTTPGQTP